MQRCIACAESLEHADILTDSHIAAPTAEWCRTLATLTSLLERGVWEP
jgi:hypothetical protein